MLWNRKKLLLCHFIIAAMVITFFFPPTRILWDAVDINLFKALNGTLVGNPTWQTFWAICNHKYFDWWHDVALLGFFFAAIYSVPKEERAKKLSQFVFVVCCIGSIVLFINRKLFCNYLDIVRLSPSLAIEDSFRLSKEITWMKIKDASHKSFPGDHATTAVLFAASYAFYSNRKLAIIGWIYGIFMCLPRLIIGAHWFSDIVLGSGSIALLFLSWAFYSPIGEKVTQKITWLLARSKSASQLQQATKGASEPPSA